jgi:acyl-CoA thioesterase-1
VLILQGGQNDSLLNNGDEIQTATAQTMEAARRFWPGVEVVVLWPSAPQPVAEELLGANSAVRAGAEAAKVHAIDAGWFTSANSPEFDFDGSYVKTAGHAHIAEKFLESRATLVQRPRAGPDGEAKLPYSAGAQPALSGVMETLYMLDE